VHPGGAPAILACRAAPHCAGFPGLRRGGPCGDRVDGNRSQVGGLSPICEQIGIGKYDINKIDVRGVTIVSLKRPYVRYGFVTRLTRWITGDIGF
jgi:hypothetical protein